jgi:integrase
MASLRFETNGKREGYRLQFYGVDKRKKSIWLGELTKKQAESWQNQVEHLISSRASGSAMKAYTAAWLGELPERYLSKLVAAGLVDRPQAEPEPETMPTIGGLCDRFIASKRAAKDATRDKFEQVKNALVRHFGTERTIDQVNAADAEGWRDWMRVDGNVREGKQRKDKHGKTVSGRTDLSDNTVRRRTGIAKQFFRWAIKSKLITENPFDGLPCSVHANEARQHFVSHATANQAIEFAPNAEWRALIALVRYGGLRSPSEPMRLKWQDVDFQNRRLKIHAKKTAHHANGGVRFCPIFPELLPYLEELALAHKAKPTDYVIRDARGAESYFRTGFIRVLEKAGLEPWPKLFQNMRASRETELLAKYPVKDVCAWIGNTQAVAMKHYAMVMESSFAEAAFPSESVEIEPPARAILTGQTTSPNENKGETICSDRTPGPEQNFRAGGSTGGSIRGEKRANPGKIDIEPRGSILDAPELSRANVLQDEILLLLGFNEETQGNLGKGEWARREPHNPEYIGKNEPDGSVVLRVVLSDAIPSDPEQLIAAIEQRCAAVVAELRADGKASLLACSALPYGGRVETIGGSTF